MNQDQPNYSSSSSDDDIFFLTFVAAIGSHFQSANAEEIRHTRQSIYRDRAAGHDRLVNDYFADNSVYNDFQFKRRFRLSRRLFLRIVNDMEGNYELFTHRCDARGRWGFTPLQKCTAAIRLLAYGIAADSLDDYLRMSERTVLESTYAFCENIIELYEKTYLRKPTRSDVEQLYAAHEACHGFRGMLGSLDCTHWHWENCPTAWRGQYTRGDHRVPTVMLEAVTSQDTWFWHAFFGPSGSNNDLNVLDQSPLFNDILTGSAPDMSFMINGHYYKQGYYLVDGIYPEYSTFVKAYRHPIEEDRKLFKVRQEGARKDVERAFGRLKQKFHIIKHPSRVWQPRTLHKIMYACVILHNMILEYKCKAICFFNPHDAANPHHRYVPGTQQYIARVLEIQSATIHHNLRNDLTTYIYQKHLADIEAGNTNNDDEDETDEEHTDHDADDENSSKE